MPPKRGAADARKRENMYFEPGVRGRKTGLTVPDSGIRDEMGMEPIDDLFSSPEKTVVMGPPATRAPAMTEAVASARKPAPSRTPAPAPRTARKQPQVQPQAQEAQIQPSPALQPQPQLQQPQPQNGPTRQVPIADETNSIEESMQIGNSTMPEPTAVLTERRKSLHQPLPRSTSPKKTFLGSPARRHPSIQPGESSPTRGTIMSPSKCIEKEPVARKLNFSHPGDDVFAPQSQLEEPRMQPAVPKSPAPAAVSKAPTMQTPGAANGKRKRVSMQKENQVAPEDIAPPDSVRSMPGAWEEATPFPSQKKSDRSFDLSPTTGLGGEGEDYQPMQMDEEEGMEDNFEQLLERTATPPEREPETKAAKLTKKKARGSLEKEEDGERDGERRKEKGKGKEVAVAEKKNVGRPRNREKEKEAVIPMAQAAEYLAVEEASKIYSEDECPALPPPKRSKLSSKDVNRKISIKKATQLAKDVESSPVQIQRGPPRPRGNGLFILRRETPAVGPFATSRVGLGRPSVKPVVRWGNEDTYVEDEDERAAPARQFVHRDVDVDLDDTPQAKRKSKREIEEEEELDLAEPWEAEPGRVNGLVKEWSSSKEASDAAEREDEIAFSGPAIITRPIPGSDVQFAKTLTLPFFGSGMVDLPPGAVKRPKNSRKMQMVFFVFKGNVKVTVNENTFRISAGGMWQVPRGNMYSIENDYEKEARIFFSQGCEVAKED